MAIAPQDILKTSLVRTRAGAQSLCYFRSFALLFAGFRNLEKHLEHSGSP